MEIFNKWYPTQTVLLQTPARALSNTDAWALLTGSDSVVLGWGLRNPISNKLRLDPPTNRPPLNPSLKDHPDFLGFVLQNSLNVVSSRWCCSSNLQRHLQCKTNSWIRTMYSIMKSVFCKRRHSTYPRYPPKGMCLGANEGLHNMLVGTWHLRGIFPFRYLKSL